MIHAVFFESDGKLSGFRISGHSGYAENGKDIVCSAVSSAVQFASNLITDGFFIPADVWVKDNAFECRIKKPDENSTAILEMLRTHIESISEEFPKTIKITIRRCNL